MSDRSRVTHRRIENFLAALKLTTFRGHLAIVGCAMATTTKAICGRTQRVRRNSLSGATPLVTYTADHDLLRFVFLERSYCTDGADANAAEDQYGCADLYRDMHARHSSLTPNAGVKRRRSRPP